MNLRVCLDCPDLTRHPTGRCTTHRQATWRQLDTHRPGTTQRGYGWEHQKAAKRQIEAQPFCTNCHQTAHQVAARGDKLTAHHQLNPDGTRTTPPRYATLCGHCNSSIGGTNRTQTDPGGAPPRPFGS